MQATDASALSGLHPSAIAPLPRRRWLTLTALLLAASFVVVGLIQWQQYTQLVEQIHDERDNLQYRSVQFVAEYQNLRHELLQLRLSQDYGDIASASMRYELFLSRVALMAPELLEPLIPATPGYLQMLRDIDHFRQLADPYLAAGAEQRLDTPMVDRLKALLGALREPIQDTVTSGFLRHGELTAQRNAVVKEQNLLRLVLTGYLFGLTLLFAGLALRVFSRYEAQRRALQEQAVELRAALAAAEAASLAKDGFLATMSHELRTPFNGLLGMLELIKDEPLSPTQRRHLATADASGQHLLGLLNDILDTAKLEAGGMQLNRAPFEIRPLVQELHELVGQQAQALNLNFKGSVANSVPAWVMGDVFRVKQILLNLLSNALKFSPIGGITLSVQPAVRPGAEPGAATLIEFVVADTGIGMDEQAMARLFKRFSQGDSSISRRFGGTGLGLEISRNLARLMGGDIHAHSSPGIGSTFTLHLPLEPVDAPIGAVGESPHPAADSAYALDVLVAEDHPINRQLIQTHLQQLGCRARMVENGREAVAAVHQRMPDLIFMDLHMPEMDGLEATRQIRALAGGGARLRIVALTADGQPEARERALAAGLDAFITKPMRRQDLRIELERHRHSAPAFIPHDPLRAEGYPSERATGDSTATPASPTDFDLVLISELRADLGTASHSRLLGRLLKDESGGLEALRKALDQASSEAGPLAHRLRGAASSFGLKALARVLDDIESRAAHRLSASEAAWGRQQVDAEWQRCREACIRAGWLMPETATAPGGLAAPSDPHPYLIRPPNMAWPT